MSNPPAQHASTPPSADDDEALELDESNAASPAETENSQDAPTAVETSAGASRSSRRESQSEGTTTGGFETMLGKVVVENGLVTADELEACNQRLSDAKRTDDPMTLGDLLVASDYATEHQLGRLRADFEAQKSSQRIPGYKIRRKVGAGAMATVFLAHQISLDRSVAIKVLPKKFSDNRSFIDRFYQEGRAAAKLNHPNIVSAYDVGKAGEHHYFVMEYVDGPTVHELIVKYKRVPESEAIDIMRQTALALRHAHERGFIHRDIKPKNIMVDRDGVVKLADLGLARALSDKDAAKAEAGRAYGTPYYISPEQIRGDVKIGPGADLYGLGATMYHMVTGRVPFTGKNPSDVMHKHLKSELTPPDHRNPELSGGCAQVIEMMMAKNPKDRYQSAADLIHDFDLIALGEPPHYARRELDLMQMAESITSGVTATMVKKDPVDQTARKDRWISILYIVSGIQLLVIIVLIAVLAGS